MPDIKTKETVKDIKLLNKSAQLALRAHRASIHVKAITPKERTESTAPANEAEQAAEAIAYQAGRTALTGIQKAKTNTRNAPAPTVSASYEPEADAPEPPHNAPKTTSRTIKAEHRTVKFTAETQPRMTIKTVEAEANAATSSRAASQRLAATKAAKRTQFIEQKSKIAAKGAEKGLKRAEKGVSRIVKAIVESGKKLAAALATGGSAALVVVVIICLVGLIVSSCYGVLFSGEVDGGMTLQEAMQTLNTEYSAAIAACKTGDYEQLHMTGSRAPWRDVIAVFAVRVTDGENAQEAVTMSEEKLDLLRMIFWDMNEISSHTETETETVVTEQEDEDGNVTTVETTGEHRHLYIHTEAKTAEAMGLAYGFDRKQMDALAGLMAKMEELDFLVNASGITDADALAVWNNLPSDLSDDRRAVLEYALSLVGRVQYFWGGKSLVLGDDPRWGSSTLVSAAGSSTTGTYRPYGLDCSGFVDWAFYNASSGSYVIGRGGGCVSQHNNCYTISWSEAIPGDLVFYPGDSHIGIVVGWDNAGNILIVHCASGSQNGVYVTGQVGFTSVARPYYYNSP